LLITLFSKGHCPEKDELRLLLAAFRRGKSTTGLMCVGVNK